MESPVTFHNKNGRRLFGIVHSPEQTSFGGGKIGINLLNPGIKYRVAPHRLNVKLARELCRKGYHVLRFDPEGIGDSEGELPDGMQIADVWGEIQTGLFVRDTISANDFFIKNYALDKLILIGNCGGAITALISGGIDERVKGLCLIDVPVYLWNAKRNIADTIVAGSHQADRIFTTYLKKLTNPSTWYKALTLQADFRTAAKLVSLKIGGKRAAAKLQAQNDNIEVICRKYQLNLRFFQSIEAAFLRNLTMLFITAGSDPGRDTFDRFFLQNYWEHHPVHKNNNIRCDFVVIDQANHVYSLTEWQKVLYERISSWLAEDYEDKMIKRHNYGL